MSETIINKRCTTHHHVCDCREEHFKELEKELELRHSWVKHHQKSVEIALGEKHAANDKVRELEQVIAEMAEALDKYIEDNYGPDIADRTLTKFKSIIEELRGKHEKGI